MARKHSRQAPAPPPPQPASGPPWVLIGGVAAIAALAFFLLYPGAPTEVADRFDAAPAAAENDAPAAAETETPEPPPVQPEPIAYEPVEVVVPAPDAPTPPYPFIPNIAPRPAELITEVYEFAGRRPDVLEFVPCFCGCESAGHRANAHCFVQDRNADGSVAAWEPHGLGCAVCIDVAEDSKRLTASGASVDDVRNAIEDKYAARFPRITPTPPVPTN